MGKDDENRGEHVEWPERAGYVNGEVWAPTAEGIRSMPGYRPGARLFTGTQHTDEDIAAMATNRKRREDE